ncbi:MAG: hypothetical protein KAI79_07785, partial [Bacteroidales bacterium]|nr:hypothetical protein [Bacteroidales bacterium]
MIKNFIQSLDNEVKVYILQDLPIWREIVKKSAQAEDPFMFFWENRQEFRTLIRYRVKMATKHFKNSSDLIHKFNKSAGNGNYLYVTNLYISCQDIGAGFYIEHGFSTIIFAKKIGKNFRVNQNVTIGTGKGGNPSIGDNVI